MPISEDPIQIERVRQLARDTATAWGEPCLFLNECDPNRECMSYSPYAVLESQADAFERENADDRFEPESKPVTSCPLGPRAGILGEVSIERDRQDSLFGGADWDDQHSATDWVSIIVRHLGLAVDDGSPAGVCLLTDHCAGSDPVRYRRQMIRVAAIAVASVETFDRKAAAWVASLKEESKT